jgi:hypothetical protein
VQDIEGLDRAYTAFTGQKAEREDSHNVTFGKVGQTYVDKEGVQRTMSLRDVKEMNKEAASNIGKDVVAKMTNPVEGGALTTKEEEKRRNSLPPNNQDSDLNK